MAGDWSIAGDRAEPLVLAAVVPADGAISATMTSSECPRAVAGARRVAGRDDPVSKRCRDQSSGALVLPLGWHDAGRRQEQHIERARRLKMEASLPGYERG